MLHVVRQKMQMIERLMCEVEFFLGGVFFGKCIRLFNVCGNPLAQYQVGGLEVFRCF